MQPPQPPLDDDVPDRVRQALPALVLSRFVNNVGFRFVYPFLPALARGLDVSFAAISVTATLREVAGLSAPVLGQVIDRSSRRRWLIIGMAGLSAGAALSGLSPGVVLFGFGMMLYGLSKTANDTAMNAWVGDHTPFSKRGFVIGWIETTWALAILVGAPVAGVLLEWVGWRAPFLLIAAGCLTFVFVYPLVITPDRRPLPSARRPFRWPHHATGLLIAAALIMTAIQQLLTVYGIWFEDDFGFSVAELGFVTVVFGVAELIGSGATVWLTDRVGKRRSVIIGTTLMLPGFLAMAITYRNLTAAILLIALVVGAFEFAWVSLVPLFTEIDPSARASTIGLAHAVAFLARAAAIPLAAFLYVNAGVRVVAALSAVLSAAAMIVLFGAVREPDLPVQEG